MSCLSVLVAAGMAVLCLGMHPRHSHHQEPVVCAFHHSCSYRTSNASSLLECSCDESCRMHGDCCRDSQHYNPQEQKSNMNDYVCVADTLAKNHVYVRAKCAEDWDNAEVQALCMKGSTIPDIFYGVPVTSRLSQSYANAYCAICNYEDPVFFKTWNAYVVCNTVPVPPVYSNDDAVQYKDNVTFAISDDYDIMYNEGRWGIIPRGSGDVTAFTPCRTDFVVPRLLRYATRQCLPTVKTCSDEEVDEHNRSLCERYTAIVYHKSLIFRNQHCASCNGYKQFTCAQPPALASTPPARPALTMLLRLRNTLMSPSAACDVAIETDQAEECRPIICPRPDEEFRHGRCVSVQGEPTLTARESLCPFYHSCSMPDYLHSRGCSCKATCRQYGDCCRDSQYYDEAEQTKNANQYVCPSDLYNGVNVHMKGKCLKEWGNTDVEASCLKGNAQTGDFKLFPVTSTTTAITYVNHYCALCNGEDTASLRMWLAKVECSTISNADFINSYNVAFYEGQWGIFEPSLGPSSFTGCSFHFEIPEEIKNYTTPCLPAVNTCSDAGPDQRDQILCQSYSAAVYNRKDIFRNQHCASCNGYKEYYCEQRIIDVRISSIPPYFAMTVDYSDSCGSNLVGHRGDWDSKLGRCVETFCIKPNTRREMGKCVAP
ncbi:hypothetical protein E2C01_055499 [Portunus trituberculatus]|uniref:SMB domain-containing protein n=1 Tax=Portunus trituberculatus TaxID=210409 RepID=A0A5B7GW41_PORTR|nr:hypothetical protein [Portunus trituberculatus]